MDIDNDSKVEILSGSIPGELYCFDRKADNTWATPQVLKTAGGQQLNVGRASAVASADWNGDGKIDLLIGNIDGAVFVVLNKGTREKPVWSEPEKLKADGKPIIAEGERAGPFVGDWDGDGKPDLVLGSGSGKVVWYRNTGTATNPKLTFAGTLIDAPPQKRLVPDATLKRPGQCTKPCVADWNGDGRPDLMVGDDNAFGTNSYRGFIWVYLRK